MHSISVACIYTFRTFHGLCLSVSLGGTKTAKIMVQKQQKINVHICTFHGCTVCVFGLYKNSKNHGTKTAKKCTHLYIPWLYCLCLSLGGTKTAKNLHILYIPWSMSLGGTKTAKSTHFVHSMVCVSWWYKNSKKSTHFVHCTFHGLSLSVSLGGTKTANEPV